MKQKLYYIKNDNNQGLQYSSGLYWYDKKDWLDFNHFYTMEQLHEFAQSRKITDYSIGTIEILIGD